MRELRFVFTKGLSALGMSRNSEWPTALVKWAKDAYAALTLATERCSALT